MAIACAQQVAGALLDGLVFKPQHRKSALMLAGAWVLLFTRDFTICGELLAPPQPMQQNFGAFESMSAVLLVYVYFVLPLTAQQPLLTSEVLFTNAAALANLCWTPFMSLAWQATGLEWQSSYRTWFIITFSEFGTWLTLQYRTYGFSLEFQNLPPKTRLVNLLHNTSHALFSMCGMVLGACGFLGSSGLLGACASFLTSCVGLDRLLFYASPSAPSLRDNSANMGGLLWGTIILNAFMPHMDRWPTYSRSRLLLPVVEAVPWTLSI